MKPDGPSDAADDVVDARTCGSASCSTPATIGVNVRTIGTKRARMIDLAP